MEAIEQMMAVGVVLVLLVGTLWWLQRRGMAGVALQGNRGRRRMASLERLALGPQQALYLVRLQNHALLLACSPAGCVLIERVPFESIGEHEIRAAEVDR